MRVWVQGCPTLYKSQVVLSIKDTPPVSKLCITSEHNGVLHRPAVILPAAPDLLEAVGSVEGARGGVRLADLEENVGDPAGRELLECVSHQVATQAATTLRRRDGQVQDVPLIRSAEGNQVARDSTIALGDEKQGIRGDAVVEVLRRPRIGKDRLLDRVNARDVRQLSGTNAGGGGRG